MLKPIEPKKSDPSSTLAKMLFDRLREEEKIKHELFDKQELFVDSTSRYSAFVAGIGSGKTYAGCVRSLKASLGYVGDSKIKTPNLGVITAPTYPMLRDGPLRTFTEVAGDHIDKVNKADMIITMKNGSEILLRTVDNPDRLRGPNVSWWYGDEAAMYRSDTWRIMVGRLRQFGSIGYAWLTTTPRGRNWVYQLFGKERENYELVRAASKDNIYLDPEIVKTWEQDYSGDFARQELLGEFVAHQGLVYDEFSQDSHVFSYVPDNIVYTTCGVDWGYANPGVMVVGGVDNDGRVWVLSERYKKQMRIEEWVDIALDLQDTYEISQFVCDPSEPSYIQQLNRAGIKASKANNSVLPGIQAVKNRLANYAPTSVGDLPRLVFHRSCSNLISELETYEWRENREGLQDQPVKAYDHAMDALRYMIMEIDNPKRKKLKSKVVRYA